MPFMLKYTYTDRAIRLGNVNKLKEGKSTPNSNCDTISAHWTTSGPEKKRSPFEMHRNCVSAVNGWAEAFNCSPNQQEEITICTYIKLYKTQSTTLCSAKCFIHYIWYIHLYLVWFDGRIGQSVACALVGSLLAAYTPTIRVFIIP